jgi:hypothetical protein
MAGNEPNWKSSTEAGQERIFINSSLFDMSEMFRQIKSVGFKEFLFLYYINF